MEVLSVIRTIIFSVFFLVLYMLPYILGSKKSYAKKLLLLNIFTGWTFIGWVASLIWALLDDPNNPAKQSQSLSFQNNYTSTDAFLALEKLATLLKQGSISVDEFAEQKSKLLTNQNNSSSINSQNLIALERLSNLYKNGLITPDEFTQQKQKLLGTTANFIQTIEAKVTNINKFSNEPTEIKKSRAAKIFSIIFIALAIIALIGTGYYYFHTESAREVVISFLEDSKNENLRDENTSYAPYIQSLYGVAVIHRVKRYSITGIKQLPNSDTTLVYTYVQKDEDFDILNSLEPIFVVVKKDNRNVMVDSYDFINVAEHKIRFPGNLTDFQRLRAAQPINSSIQILSSKHNIVNEQASGTLSLKNNLHYPVQDIDININFRNKQRDIVKQETLRAIDGTLNPGQIRNFTWLADSCSQYDSADVYVELIFIYK